MTDDKKKQTMSGKPEKNGSAANKAAGNRKAPANAASHPQDAGPAPSFRSLALSHRKPTRFRWTPDAAARAELAKALDLQDIAFLSFKGEILPEGRADFRLVGDLVADVTQTCVITLGPVPTHIEEPVLRRFLADWQEPEAEEVEIPEDDSMEALPEVIDLGLVATEALSLALPPYPRAEGAELGEAVHTEEGKSALKDEDLKPFAGLAQLLKKSQEGGEAGD